MDMQRFEKVIELCDAAQLTGLLQEVVFDIAAIKHIVKRAARFGDEFDYKKAFFYGNTNAVMVAMVKENDWATINELRETCVQSFPSTHPGEVKTTFNHWVMRNLLEANCPASVYDSALDWQPGDDIGDVFTLCTSSPQSMRWVVEKSPQVLIKQIAQKPPYKSYRAFAMAACAGPDIFKQAVSALKGSRRNAASNKVVSELVGFALLACIDNRDADIGGKGVEALLTSGLPCHLDPLPLGQMEKLAALFANPVCGKQVKSILENAVWKGGSDKQGVNGENASLSTLLNLERLGVNVEKIQNEAGDTPLHQIAKGRVEERARLLAYCAALKPEWLEVRNSQNETVSQIISKEEANISMSDSARARHMQAFLLALDTVEAPSSRPRARF